jgi:hypothetical protein
MKKATILMVIVALLVTLGSGAALAKAFNGTNGPDDLTGTNSTFHSSWACGR